MMKLIRHITQQKMRISEMLWLSLIPFLSLSYSASCRQVEHHQSKTRSEFEFLFQKQNSLQDFEEKFQKMESIRSNAEVSLVKLLKQRKGDLELELRLAELHLQKARDVEHYSLELEFSNQSERAKEMKAEFKLLSKKGLQLHEKLLHKNSLHPLVSDIYLGMARTRLGLGDRAGALRDAIEGIRTFKRSASKVLLNLWIVKGDAAFSLQRSGEALQAFEKAKSLAEKAGEDSAYIVYKLAWTHFNLKDPGSALTHLDDLLVRTQDKLSLRKEAVQDYALFMVDLDKDDLQRRGGVVGVFDYLKKVAGLDSAVKAFESLGKNYFKNGHRSLALETYEHLLKQNIVDPNNISRALLVVEWSQSLADKWELAEKYKWLLKDFGPKSAWYAAQIHKPDVQKNAYDRIEDSLRKFSTSLHQDATKESATEVRDRRETVVADLYDAYLASFSEEPRVYYYRAEIFRRKNDWALAGQHYDQFLVLLGNVPDDKKNANDTKLTDEAALGSVLVWSKAIDKDPKFVPNMLKSCDYFIEKFPTHAMAAQVALDAAKVELKIKHTAVALRRIESLYKNYPRTPQASQGVNAALDILNQEKDYVNLAIKARLFRDNIAVWAMPAEREKQKAELTAILSKTEAKACESLSQTSGKDLEAALCFESFANDFNKDPLAPRALLMAADIYTKKENTEAALNNLEKLVKNYPNSEQAVEAFSKLALAFERNFEFAKATEVFEILLRKNDRVAEREKIALRLLVLLEGLGEEKRLEKLLTESFINPGVKKDFFERRSYRILANLEKALAASDLEKGRFKTPAVQSNFDELEANAQNLPIEAALRFARVKGISHRSNNKLDLADQSWMAALKMYWKSSEKRNPRVLEAAARLRLEQASIWETTFKNTDFIKSGARKTELYAKLENWYAEVVGFKSPAVALEALLKSAKLSMEFSSELEGAVARAPASDQAAITQVSKDLKTKGDTLVQQVAARAKAWKVVTPSVVEAVSLKTGSQTVAAERSQDHPWGPLTLWLDLSSDQSGWAEWAKSDSSLQSQMRDRSARSASRRAAFVLMSRTSSVSNPELHSWSQLHTDRAGIQARIQALVNDQKFRMAHIYIDQYQGIFGNDAFVPYSHGLLSWAEGNFEEAFRHWMTAGKKDDFRLAFIRMAWAQGLEQGKLKSKDYETLNALAETQSQKHLLARVCLGGFVDCPASKNFDSSLDAAAEAPFERDFAWGTLDYRFKAYALSLRNGIARARDIAELENQFSRLNGFYNLKNFADDKHSAQIKEEFLQIKKLVEEKGRELRQDKGRVVAGSKSQAEGAVQ